MASWLLLREREGQRDRERDRGLSLTQGSPLCNAHTSFPERSECSLGVVGIMLAGVFFHLLPNTRSEKDLRSAGLGLLGKQERSSAKQP